MSWFFKPKVQLGLWVNFVFVVFTIVSSTFGEHTHGYGRPYVSTLDPSAAHKPLPYVSLPPPSGPTKATSYSASDFGETDVYLENDLTLIRRPGHTLLLSPTCAVHSKGETPYSVLLRFVSFSDARYFAYDSSLVITADGR